jgi:hypothetical protein
VDVPHVIKQYHIDTMLPPAWIIYERIRLTSPPAMCCSNDFLLFQSDYRFIVSDSCVISDTTCVPVYCTAHCPDVVLLSMHFATLLRGTLTEQAAQCPMLVMYLYLPLANDDTPINVEFNLPCIYH